MRTREPRTFILRQTTCKHEFSPIRITVERFCCLVCFTLDYKRSGSDKSCDSIATSSTSLFKWPISFPFSVVDLFMWRQAMPFRKRTKGVPKGSHVSYHPCYNASLTRNYVLNATKHFLHVQAIFILPRD